MVNLYQRDKNLKQDHQSTQPYEKDAIDEEVNNYAVKELPEEHQMSGSEFLLSIAGMFSSGTTDTSENVEQYIAEALKKKYS